MSSRLRMIASQAGAGFELAGRRFPEHADDEQPREEPDRSQGLGQMARGEETIPGQPDEDGSEEPSSACDEKRGPTMDENEGADAGTAAKERENDERRTDSCHRRFL